MKAEKMIPRGQIAIWTGEEMFMEAMPPPLLASLRVAVMLWGKDQLKGLSNE